MNALSDVFAFAVKHPDYWKDLFFGESYPPELTDDEAKALEGAREHIEALVVELLHDTGRQFAAKVGPKLLAPPRFKGASTAKNRSIWLKAPAGLESKLYGVLFGLEPNEDAGAVALFATLSVKKGSLDDLRAALDARATKYSVDDYYVYAPSIALVKGAEVSALATEASSRAYGLLEGFLER